MHRLQAFLTGGVAWILLAGGIGSVSGQPGRSAASIADRQNLLTEYKRLNSAVEELMAAQNEHAKRLRDISQNVRSLEATITERDDRYATMEDVGRLEKAIEKLDQKIERNNKLILDEIQKLRQGGSVTPDVSSRSGAPEADSGNRASEYDYGYHYVIEKGDTVSAIVRAYNKEDVPVTIQMVLDANPGLDASRLQPGQEIFIPDPSQ